MADELDRLAKWAEKQGWTVDRTEANGYWHFYTPDGTHAGYYPNTPGRPSRRWKRLILDLKKHDLEWPPPSKSVQRSRRKKEGH